MLSPEHDDDSDAVYTGSMIILFGNYDAAVQVHSMSGGDYDVAKLRRGKADLKDENMLTKKGTFRHFKFVDRNSYGHIFLK